MLKPLSMENNRFERLGPSEIQEMVLTIGANLKENFLFMMLVNFCSVYLECETMLTRVPADARLVD